MVSIAVVILFSLNSPNTGHSYIMLVTGFFLTLKEFLCSQCINFACPLNSVGEDARLEFFKKTPIVAKAWGVEV